MEIIFAFIVGFLVGAFCVIIKPRKKKDTDVETDPEKQRAVSKAIREYKNFLNYDGFPADDVGNT